mgnify:CR=1 FL=1
MNARNQLLVVLTALMLVCSSGAMVTAATSGTAIDQSSEVSEDEYDSANETVTETANETGGDAQAADNETELADNESAAQPAYVTFNDQTSDGETVVVENVTLASPGFVTIHNSSLLVGNVIDSVIGTSEYLEAGTHENVTVTLDDPLEESETLIAMPHRDTNDNQTYDFVETDGQEDGPFRMANGEPVTDEAVVTVDGAADEEPVDEPVEDDNVTDDEPVEDDNLTDDEPVEDDNVTDDDSVIDAPSDELPIDELPVDGDGQPIVIMVENPTIEDLSLENVTVYVLVVGEDVDADEIADQIDNVTDGEMVEDDNVTDDEPVEDDNATDDEPVEDDNVTDDEMVGDDNVTEAPAAGAFNISDLEAPESATIGETITVTANVSNPTDAERTEAIQFRLDGDLVTEQNVTLESDESDIVEFDVDTSDLAPGEYIHMVLGDEAGEVAPIELVEAAEDDLDAGTDESEDAGIDNETNESDGDIVDTNVTAD